MAVSYKKLFKLMIDRNLKKKDLKKMTGLSYTTIAELEKVKLLDLMSWIKFAVGSVVS